MIVKIITIKQNSASNHDHHLHHHQLSSAQLSSRIWSFILYFIVLIMCNAMNPAQQMYCLWMMLFCCSYCRRFVRISIITIVTDKIQKPHKAKVYTVGKLTAGYVRLGKARQTGRRVGRIQENYITLSACSTCCTKSNISRQHQQNRATEWHKSKIKFHRLKLSAFSKITNNKLCTYIRLWIQLL